MGAFAILAHSCSSVLRLRQAPAQDTKLPGHRPPKDLSLSLLMFCTEDFIPVYLSAVIFFGGGLDLQGLAVQPSWQGALAGGTGWPGRSSWWESRARQAALSTQMSSFGATRGV